MNDQQAPRGNSSSQMREAVCKDCLREERAKERAAELGLPVADLPEDFDKEFRYNEQAARTKLERGQTRSDRCKRHRGQHQINIQGMAVPYIDLQTIGEAIGAQDPEGPSGPFGGLGPMPPAHKMAAPGRVDLGKFGFGMDEGHIHKILNYLANPQTRICVVKAGTGTGKSTYMPYRLLDPPEKAAIRLADLGPIIVTEPRVQATVGVADFVGTKMSGAGGVGPGYPVGFQVSGQRAHDDSCQLIYVTDGTMINWLREGRLSTIGTVIVDEAHERSTNIDFIMGFLKKAIDRHPHLRVIITSATFDERFYQEYFGGPGKVEVVDVPAVKTIGYGFPLFPELDAAAPEGTDLRQAWTDVVGPELPLRETLDPGDRAFVAMHFQELAPPLQEAEVAQGHEAFIGWPENLYETTTKLLPLRYQGPTVPAHQWKEKMPKVLGEYIVRLVRGLDEADVFGDILGFLPTGKSIDEAVAIIKDGLGIGEKPAPGDPATVYALLSSLEADQKELALTAQGKGDKRKIVISTNLAETSLTVEGVRFVVDSGLIAQSEWDPAMAQGGIPTKAHSQAGIRQRWGRVGRKAPGWVFPLYTKAQFLDLSQDTPPGSARSNLEQLIMTAKLGGIDDVVRFDWPAKFLPPDDSGVVLDETALKARDVFLAELDRAADALRTSGAVDTSGDPTSFGKELSRSPGLGSTASTIAIMHADRLACVPEVVTILKLLDNTSMVGAKGLLLDRQDWPDEWRLEASERHRALATGCQDDAELALQVMAVWERAAPGVPPWKPSTEREQWARRWWINHDALLDCAAVRRTVLEGLSPAMKEEVKRFVEPALVKRARGAITRSMSSLEYRLGADGVYRAAVAQGDTVPTGVLGNAGMTSTAPERIIPLKRTKLENREHAFLSNLIRLEDWALPPAASDGEAVTSAASAMQFLADASRSARPETARDTLSQLQHVWPAGLRVQLEFGPGNGEPVVVAALASIEPAAQPAAAEAVADEVEDGAADATPEDASPELDTSWPTPVPMETDPEMDARRAVIDIEEYERDLVACLACVACLRGDLEECEEPLVPVEAARATDELTAWRERASRNLDVSRPRVIADGPVESGLWYEVAGYDVTGPAPAIRIRPDWRAPGSAWAPAVHPGFEQGQLIEVEVGPELSDHRGDLRAFTHRVSGDRFVLREATHKPEKQDEFNKLAISLHRRTAGLLSQLTPGESLFAHVIPLPERGCSTITLLGSLSAHWQSRANRPEKLDIVRPDGSAGQGQFYRAIVQGEPQVERAVAAAAVRDSDRGIRHLFGLRLVDPDDPDTLCVPDGLIEGQALLVQVRPEVARLAVGGLQVAALQAVLDRHPGTCYPPAPPQQPGPPPSEPVELPELSTLDRVPAGWLLGRRNPLSRRAAQDLAALDQSSDSWVSRCWFFWARSHHVQTSQRDAFRLAPSAERIEVAADRNVLSTDDRGQLAGAIVRAARPPGYWRASLAKAGDRMAELLGADAVFPDGNDLVAAFANADEAERGAAALRTALALPGAMVTVDGSVAGRIIGKGGANLRTVQDAPGVWIYSYDRVGSTVMIVAEPAALAVAVANVVRISSGTTARMIVPPGYSGRMIGRQGSMKNDLLARSGCTFANPIEHGADEWKVQGPTSAAVTNFLELAAGVVAGTTGEITESMSATVVDLVSDAVVTNYAANGWTHSSLTEVTVATKARAVGPE